MRHPERCQSGNWKYRTGIWEKGQSHIAKEEREKKENNVGK